jgi:sorting nexin-9/18/33
MQQPPDAEHPLTPPITTKAILSFARAQGQASRSRREAPALPLPANDFDAGINTSNAWTVYLDSDSSRSRSLSDHEAENDDSEETIDGRGARVLFAFAGKAEFSELNVKAGDEITVIREQTGDGWSLVRTRSGVTGLLPRSYYTVNPFPFTTHAPP